MEKFRKKVFALVDKKREWVNIQFRGTPKSIPEEQWLKVPEYKEEKQFIYICNDWKG